MGLSRDRPKQFTPACDSVEALQHASNPADLRRQALVILSDGDDTASLVRYDDVLDAVRRSGVTIYAVSLRLRGESDPPHVLRPRTGYFAGGDLTTATIAHSR